VFAGAEANQQSAIIEKRNLRRVLGLLEKQKIPSWSKNMFRIKVPRYGSGRVPRLVSRVTTLKRILILFKPLILLM
jgi:hypothetical protein